jgi:hypothetical protein
LLDKLPLNRARIEFVARFLLALYVVQTVKLSTLATAFSGHANNARIKRKLNNALARAIQMISVDDIRRWFAHCGYVRSPI